MDKYILPYSRDCDDKNIYDEGYTVLCSNNTKKILKEFDNVGYVIDFNLAFLNIEQSIELPTVTPTLLKNKYKNSKIIYDETLPIETQKALHKEFEGTNISLIPLGHIKETCPNIPCECTTINLSIDALGDIYPCPKPKVKVRQKISNIKMNDCIEHLVNYIPDGCQCKKGYMIKAKNPLNVKRVAIEFGGQCSSACVYCYQRHTFKRDGNEKGNNYNYEALEKFLDALTIKEICVAGGEVLAQNNTLDFLVYYKRKRPEIRYYLKTNGFSEKYELLGDIFEDVSVSLNGFSQPIVSTIMSPNINIETVKSFCQKAKDKCGYTHLKFLLSPLNITDVPAFLDWAIDLQPDEISFTKAMVFKNDADGAFSGSSFKGINMAYWKEIFDRVTKKSNEIIRNKDKEIVSKIKMRYGMGADRLLRLQGI